MEQFQVKQMLNQYYTMQRVQMFTTMKNAWKHARYVIPLKKRILNKISKAWRKTYHKLYFLPTLIMIRYKRFRINLRANLMFRGL